MWAEPGTSFQSCFSETKSLKLACFLVGLILLKAGHSGYRGEKELIKGARYKLEIDWTVIIVMRLHT